MEGGKPPALLGLSSFALPEPHFAAASAKLGQAGRAVPVPAAALGTAPARGCPSLGTRPRVTLVAPASAAAERGRQLCVRRNPRGPFGKAFGASLGRARPRTARQRADPLQPLPPLKAEQFLLKTGILLF